MEFVMVYLYMFFCTLNMVAGVTLMFAATGAFVLPPIFSHHWVNIFMAVMGAVLFGFGYLSAWRHKC
jgi:hypothetical protein